MIQPPRLRRARSPAEIFAAPAGIALASLVGLISALTGDGLPDIVSWLALGVPVVVAAWALATRKH